MKEYPEFTQALAPVTANQAGGEIVLNAEDAVLVQQIHAVFQQIGIYDLMSSTNPTSFILKRTQNGNGRNNGATNPTIGLRHWAHCLSIIPDKARSLTPTNPC